MNAGFPLLADYLLVAVISLDVYIVATSRLGARVRACALQGVVHALLPLSISGAALLAHPGGVVHLALTTSVTFLLKAVVIPYAMLHAIRHSGMRREVEAFVSLHQSLIVAVVLVGVSFGISAVVATSLRGSASAPLALPAGLSTLLIGLFLAVNGKTALSQIIGYQVTQNGVFVMGQTLLGEFPLMVELGVLLDVLVAVMLTGLFVVQLSGGDEDALFAGEAREDEEGTA